MIYESLNTDIEIDGVFFGILDDVIMATDMLQVISEGGDGA